ncbi:hypothetical protein M2138_001582 [Dysgonomonadaceae bacterium PH5-43]|nr:hypothetical protein [Dysgonomonadaceae bacterium PH5-43]
MRTQITKKILCLVLLCTTCSLVSYGTIREKINIGTDWKFKTKILTNAPATEDYDDSSWSSVSIPHTWNALDAQDGGSAQNNNSGSGYLQTTSWYRKTLKWNQEYEGKKIYLDFLGANIQAEVYINGVSVGIHKGGYTAFRFDITNNLKEGDNIIAVKVDNDNNGSKLQDIAPISGDFSFYGGIYRKIHIVVVNPVHVDLMDKASSGLYLTTTNVSNTSANLEVRAKVVNESNEPKTVNLKAVFKHPDTFNAIDEVPKPVFDVATMTKNGEVIETLNDDNIVIPANSSYEFKKQITVSNPRLWNGLEDPYRYLVDFTVSEGNSVIDAVSEYVGFRYFSANQNGFYLNGKLYPLRGICRHQDWEGLGNAITETEHNIDFGMMYDIGANTVRLAHYPQDPYMYDLCDRYGIVVWAEIPFVDHIGNNANFETVTRQQLEEMIKQQYNRPSILMWGLQNEVKSSYDAKMIPMMQGLHDLAYSIDPTRLTVQATNQGTARNWKSDLIGWNIYHGWYQDGSLGGFMDGCRNKTVPEGMAEYGAGANVNHHEIGRTTRPQHDGDWHPEEWQNYVHEAAAKSIATRNYIWGTYIWNMFEFGSDWRDEGERPGVNDKGLVTFDRSIKKDSYYLYRANWSKDPFSYISSRRFNERDVDDTPVTIYSNCESVELFLNGVSQGKKTKTSNTCGIFTWNKISLTNVGENTIKVVGLSNGKEYTDEIIWNRVLASSTSLTSSTLYVDNAKKRIGLTTEDIAYNQLDKYLIGDKGATFALFESDGTTAVTSGTVKIGMKVIVTSESGKETAIYNIVASSHLALGKAVTTDSTEAGNDASNAVDGNSSTRWAAANSSSHWLQIDLGKKYILNQVVVHWFNNTSSSRSYYYTIGGSNNGSSFTTLVNRSTNTVVGKVTSNISNKEAQYLKINVTGSSTGSAYPSIYEVEVYGWMLESDVYEVNFDKGYILVPEPEGAANITTAEFSENVTISGIQNNELQTASYFIQNGDKLIITDSQKKKNEFNIYIGKLPNSISTISNDSNLFAITENNGFVEIKLSDNVGEARLEVYDIVGKTVYSSIVNDKTELNLPSGVYVFKVSTDSNYKTVKYIVK